MFISFELQSEPMTYQELNSKLIENKVPFPIIFTAVAIYESGWQFQSGLAEEGNNLFGFICITPTCYGAYSKWNSKEDCINYLIKWIHKNPPNKKENGIDYLKRRKYNPNPSYYNVVQGIVVKLEKEFYCD